MRDSRARRGQAAAAAALAAAALLGAGCGGDEDPATTGSAGATVSTTSVAEGPPPIRERDDVERGAEADGSQPDAAAAGEEELDRAIVREAQAVYRSYLTAINARDGATLCRLLAPGFEDELELPEKRGACAERVSRSIGHRDPRGFPVWKSTELSSLESAIVGDGGRVQLSVAIATLFADRDEASIESDIAFLEPAGGGYVLAKAPGSMWRAVGKPDVPPSAITPPPGF